MSGINLATIILEGCKDCTFSAVEDDSIESLLGVSENKNRQSNIIGLLDCAYRLLTKHTTTLSLSGEELLDYVTTFSFISNKISKVMEKYHNDLDAFTYHHFFGEDNFTEYHIKSFLNHELELKNIMTEEEKAKYFN